MAINKNYHPVVNELMGAIKSANPTMPEEASAIMANYKLVSMVSNLRVKIDYNKSMGLAPVNFYGICLMDSGVGKTSSLSTLDLWYFKDVKDRLKGLYDKARKLYIEELRNSDLEDDEIGEAISALSQWTFSISSGTKEGISKLAQTLFKLKALTVGIEIDELDKYITSESELMNSLFKAYDVGEWNPKITAGKQLEDSVYGVAPNFFGLATPDAMLLNRDVADPFRGILASGFARRTFFYYEDSDKLPYIPTEDDYIKLEDEAVKLRENAKSLAETFKNMLHRDNLEKVISFPTKAKKYIYRYRSESVEKASQTQDPIMNAEYRERHFKVAKLAGAYAFIDGRDEVTIKDIDYAIYLTEHSSASLERIGDSKSLVERLYLRVRSEEGFVHTQDMLNFGLVSKNQTTKIKEYAEELETYADVYGDIFEVMRDNNGKISAVRITQLITTNSESCIFSASMPRRDGTHNHDSGYKKVEIDFNSIAEWVTQEKNICYSPVAFKDGKRNNASTEAYSNLIVMDIDEGMSIDYAKEIFKDYYAIITTTRNHQKEKNGVVSDRFRVILLANKYIFTTPKKYKQLMENIQKFYDFSMDTACFDKAHIYYSNPSEIWIGSCEKKLEVSKLIPSDDDHISKKIAREPIQSFRPDSGRALKLYFEQKAKDAGNAGTGIVNILSTAMLATKDKMEGVFKTSESAEEWIQELADYAPDSYWDKHSLEQEVLIGLRRRWNES
jgi:hypothetical protein